MADLTALTPHAAAAPRRRSYAATVARRFGRHKLAVASLVVFVLVAAFAFIGPLLWRYDYRERTFAYSQPPSAAHPFGTDTVSHDLMALVMHGTQRSLEIALLVAVVATVVGTLWGAVAGFYRGIVDGLLMRVVDIFLAVPVIAVAALLAYQVGGRTRGWFLIALVLAGLMWTYVARVVRSDVLSLRERDFVTAARALGAGDARIIWRHLVPNVAGTVTVSVTVLVAMAILGETALSYLGFGIHAPDTSLGLLVNDGQTAVLTRPWLFYFPGVFILLIALCVNFIGDGLRDAFDPAGERR